MKIPRTVQRRFLEVAFVLLLGIPSHAQDAPQPAPLEMVVGESTVITARKLNRLAIGNPAVADTMLFPNRDDQVVVNAKAAGITTLNVWDAEGQRSWRVFVSHSASGMRSEVYEFTNYSLTQTTYDPNMTKITVQTDTANVTNLTTLLTPILGAESFSIDANNNRVTLRGTDADITTARAALDALDKPSGQVAIEARIVDLTKDDLKQMGVTLGAQRGKVSAGADLSAGNSLSVTFETFTALAKRFNITLDMLNQLTVGRTLTNPKVTALDGRTAWILVGEKFPIATRDRDGLLSYTYINTGIVLAIKPRIGKDGTITLWIKPEVSAITSWVGNPQGSANNAAPIISTREAMSELRVKDDEPIIIGGLKRSQSTVTRSKTPILGDWPVIGSLFRKKHTENQESELVIIITPHILKGNEKVTDNGAVASVDVAPPPAAAPSGK